jgi:hypothetical protein
MNTNRIPNNIRELAPWAINETPADPWDGFDDSLISEEKSIAWNIEVATEQQKQFEAQQKAELAIDEKLTPNQVRAEFEKQVAVEDTKTLAERQDRAARTFCVEEPRFIACPANAKRVHAFLEARGLRGDNPEDFHQAFTALDSQGLLKVNAQSIQPRPEITERDLEKMPLEQLRELADREMRSRSAGTRLVRMPRPRR